MVRRTQASSQATSESRSLQEILSALTQSERAAAVAEFDRRLAEGEKRHQEGLVASRVTMVVPAIRPD